jgi:hypothetical protein
MKFLDVPQSGSIAGVTHSHNRAGQYTRNRRSPVQPIGSGRRASVRAAFSAASSAWSALTGAQRAAWEGFAGSHPITDSLGQSVVLTGHQMYVRVYSSQVNVGIAPDVLPPAVLTLPDCSGAVLTASVASGLSTAGFSGTGDQKIAFAYSPQFSAGRSYNKTFWQPPGVDGIADGDGTPFVLASATYAAEFGTPVVGNRIFVRMTPVSENGWNGTPVIISDIVAA